MNKYCVDCRHSKAVQLQDHVKQQLILVYGEDFDSRDEVRCLKPGRGIPAMIYRFQDDCGPEGKFWEAKELIYDETGLPVGEVR